MMRGRGFTLIELLLVVVILGVLAAMVVPRLAGRSEQARAGAAQADVTGALPMAIDLYEVDTGKHPQNLAALRAAPQGVKNWRGPYLKKTPVDPWGREYYYEYPAKKGQGKTDYDLASWGPDGVEGGSDDIVNWASP